MVNRCDMSSFPWVQGFTGRTHRTQHTVILMATNYIIRKTQSKISKGKRLMGSSLEETRHKLPGILSCWSHTGRTELQ